MPQGTQTDTNNSRNVLSTEVNFLQKIYTVFKTSILFQLNYTWTQWNNKSPFCHFHKPLVYQYWDKIWCHFMSSRPIKCATRSLSVGAYWDSDKMTARGKCRLCSETQRKSLKDPSMYFLSRLLGVRCSLNSYLKLNHNYFTSHHIYKS